jgi:hypothetical protein
MHTGLAIRPFEFLAVGFADPLLSTVNAKAKTLVPVPPLLAIGISATDAT